jgi:glycogen debranching enzyme
LPRGTVHIFRSQFLGAASHYEHLRILNYGLEQVRLALLFQFDADFADIFEVRGTRRPRKGERLEDHVEGCAAILAYQGLDGVFRRTRLEFSPQPTTLTTREALFRIAPEPQQETSIYTTVACQRDASTNGVVPFQTAFRALKRESDRARSEGCEITTSSESFNSWIIALPPIFGCSSTSIPKALIRMPECSGSAPSLVATASSPLLNACGPRRTCRGIAGSRGARTGIG